MMKDQNPTTVESHVDDAVEESAESLRSSTVGGCILDGVNAMDPVVVCATDDRYIMPLAVTLYSAAQNLRAGRQIKLFLLDGGVTQHNKSMLKDSLANLPIQFQWIKFDSNALRQFNVSHHISHTAYFRLLLADVLPKSVDKVIYLDCDLLVRGDLLELWELPVESVDLWAARDIACPYVDAQKGNANAKKSNPYLAVYRPIPNYQELGIDSSAPYFNSGVLVINLERWRQKQLSRQLLACLKENERHVWCWDQYALNVVLHGHWKSLPMQWNMGTHVYEYPSIKHSPIDAEEFERMANDPKIVHFTTEWKPWHFGIEHKYREAFFEALDETAWRGWRPERPQFRMRKLVDRFMVSSIRSSTIAYRKLSSIW